MRIARFQLGGRPIIAADIGDGFIDYGALLEERGYRSEVACDEPEVRLIRLMARGLLDEAFALDLIGWGKKAGKSIPVETAGLTPLLPLRPGKIVCMARNWREHARETGHNLPEEPVFFVKTANCAIGPEHPIPVPVSLGRVDHEGEVGLIIGRRTARVKRGDAHNYIFGWIIVNDVTARELQKRYAANGWPWYAAKSMDGFAPMGPWVVTKSEIKDPDKASINVWVNGTLRQQGLIGDMHFKVGDIVEAVSKYITLETGDVICTGTPPGIGPIVPGDEVVVEVSSIGRLSNPVIAAE